MIPVKEKTEDAGGRGADALTRPKCSRIYLSGNEMERERNWCRGGKDGKMQWL
jgi:hypothetical protein